MTDLDNMKREAAKIIQNVPKPPGLPPELSTKPPKTPPILDPTRKGEVKAMLVQLVGSIVITAIVIGTLLLKIGWDLYLFLLLLAVESKSELISLVSFLTGAKSKNLEIKHKQEKEQWENEKEIVRFKLTEAEIERNKLQSEIDWGKRMQEELKKLFLQNGTP